MSHELFWIRNTKDIFENAIDQLPTDTGPPPKKRRWSKLEHLQLLSASILVEPTSGSWVAISPPCPSLTAAKKLIGNPIDMPQDQATFLFRRNILTDDQMSIFYPPTVETPEGRNLPIRYLFVVETTERCNLGCLYCFKSASTAAVDMTKDMARQVAEYIAAFKQSPITVDFSGGEPTLNLQAIEIIASILAKKAPQAQFTIQSNATLVNDNLIKLARRYNIIVGSSLEGSIENLRTLRPFANGRDASHHILDGIRKLKKEGLFGGVVSSFSSSIKNNPRLFLDVLDHAGVTSLKLNLCASLGRWDNHKEEVEAVLEKYTEYIKRLVEDGFSRSPPIRESITAIIAERILNRIPEYRCMNSPCDAGYTFQNIRPNGDIFPCDRYSRFPELRLGNITSVLASKKSGVLKDKNRITEFTSSLVSHNRMTDRLNRRTIRSIAVCSRCPLRSYCGSGCGMESYCKFGSFDQPSAQCEFYKKYIPQVFEWLITSSVFKNIYYPNGYDKFSLKLLSG
jgi:uncharacterized protein